MKKLAFIVFFVVAVGLMGILPAAAGSARNLLLNGDFDGLNERAADISPWTVTHGNGDKVVCATVLRAPLPYSEPCMFVFKGGTTPTILQQKLGAAYLDEINGWLGCSSANLTSWFRIYASQTPNVRLTLKVKYLANSVSYNVKATEQVAPLLGSWQAVGHGLVPLPLSAEVTSVVYQIRHANLTGKVFIDEAHLDLVETGAVC